MAENISKEKLNTGELSHLKKLEQIRKRYLNSSHPLRFIDYALEEAWYMNEYMNEYNFRKNKPTNLG